MQTRTDTRKLTTLAIFTALVIVLQLVSALLTRFVPALPVSITLTLVPIVVGAALYGVSAGAYLGFIFGVVVLIISISGLDIGGSIMWNVNPLMTAVICLVKGTAAGACAGAVYRALSGRNKTTATVCAGITAPVVNTALFVLGALLFFQNTLNGWSAAWAEQQGRQPDLLLYIILGLAGINFLVELCVNLILAPVIVRIINARQK